MFENKIYETQLVGAIGDCMFRRINGSAYDEDVSFISTLRALLMNRLSDGNSVTLSHLSINTAIDEMEECKESINAAAQANNALIVCNISTCSVADDAAGAAFFSEIPTPDEYHEFADVRQFFSEKMECRAFVNEELRSAVVMIRDMNIRKYHLAQCIIPKLLPWFFADNKISVQERDLLLSLKDKRSACYVAALEAICGTTRFMQMKTGAALSAFKIKSLEKQKTGVEREIVMINSRIENLNSSIAHEFRNLNDENMRLNGIMSALQSDEQETDDNLSAFIASNRNIKLLNTDDGMFRFAVEGYLDVYDPESYRTLSRNGGSWYWIPRETPSREFRPIETRKLILNSIFGDNPTFKLKTVGIFELNIDYSEVACASRHTYESYCSTHYPNPHLYYNRCLGANRMPVNRAASRGDFIGVISQCISATHSVNVTESASFRYLCTDLFTGNAPILENIESGETYTPIQALRFLSQNSQEQ